MLLSKTIRENMIIQIMILMHGLILKNIKLILKKKNKIIN